jgi:hypothetical protein
VTVTWLRCQAKLTVNHILPDGKDYYWCIINIITRWILPDKMVVISFDTPADIKVHFRDQKLKSLQASWLLDPYWPHLLFLEQLLSIQDIAVWSIRDRVRNIEDVSKTIEGYLPHALTLTGP